MTGTIAHMLEAIRELEHEIDRLNAMIDHLKMELLTELAASARLRAVIDEHAVISEVRRRE